jgi:hypothetical protein
MSKPQEVKRKPLMAAKFEGGEKEGKEIVEWIRKNDPTDVAIWTPDGTDTFERIEIEGIRHPLLVGMWVVYEWPWHHVLDEVTFRTRYDVPNEDAEPQKEPFKDFVERHYGKEEAQRVYVACELTVKAMRMPSPKENEASKDLEERVRAIAQFIDAEGGSVFDFKIDELGISYEGKNIRLEPGEWVVSDFKNELHFLSHEDFRLFYKSIEEASNDAQPA